RLQLNDAVEFVSGISTEALVEHYNRATIAVSPSLYEGFGLPAGEAMACATPVISSDGGALPEVVGDAGRIVAAGDSHALANSIAELLAQPALRRQLGNAARARIEQHFSWQVCATHLCDYYARHVLPKPEGARLAQAHAVAQSLDARCSEHLSNPPVATTAKDLPEAAC
ncbi:MAG: glycosyltransferase, partial [Gammaproteobacteria bacterium]|nr:glycosyltransferase [Gammaproteobacteria bacterium]